MKAAKPSSPKLVKEYAPAASELTDGGSVRRAQVFDLKDIMLPSRFNE
jgi:hypothetical protein